MKRPRPPNCQVCRHEERWRIELLRAGGASLDSLAKKFGVDRDAIWRHWHKHVSAEAKAGHLAGIANMEHLAERAAEEGASVLDYLKVCRGTLVTQLSVMQVAGDSKSVAYVTGHLVKVLEAIARVTGEIGGLAQLTINNTTNVGIINSPTFARMQAAMLRALQDFPEARVAVVAALRSLDHEHAHTATSAPAIGKVIDHVAA